MKIKGYNFDALFGTIFKICVSVDSGYFWFSNFKPFFGISLTFKQIFENIIGSI